MKEEKYIQSIFEKARQEIPHTSFEETSHVFEASLNPGTASVLKGWFFKHIYLNSIVIIVAVMALSFTLFQDLQAEKKQTAAVTQNPEKIENNTKDYSTTTIKKESQIQTIKTLAPSALNKVETTKVQPKQRIKTPVENIQNKIENTKIQLKQPKVQKTSTENKSTVMQENISLAKPEKGAKQDKPKQKDIQEIEKKNIVETNKVKKADKSLEQTIAKSNKMETRSDLELILETALNTDELKTGLFVRNSADDFQQLILLTNYKFDDLININFSTKKVIVLESLFDGGFNIVNDDYVNVIDFSTKDDMAFLEFVYNSVNVKIELEKINDVWSCTDTTLDNGQQNGAVKEELIQLALDNDKMKELVGYKADGHLNHFAVLANDHLSNKINLNFAGNNLDVILQKTSQDYNKRVTYAVIKKIQVKRKKAAFHFFYKGDLITVNYRMKNDQWTVHSFKY